MYIPEQQYMQLLVVQFAASLEGLPRHNGSDIHQKFVVPCNDVRPHLQSTLLSLVK